MNRINEQHKGSMQVLFLHRALFSFPEKIFKYIFENQEHFAPSHLVRVIEGETRRAADAPAALPFSLRFFLLEQVNKAPPSNDLSV